MISLSQLTESVNNEGNITKKKKNIYIYDPENTGKGKQIQN